MIVTRARQSTGSAYQGAAYAPSNGGTGREGTRKVGATLWVVQALLAALFLLAGGSKLLIPAAQLAALAPLPVSFLRFVGLCETLGALGLILPGLTRIQPVLTPLAAAGLVIIMIGATTVTQLSVGATAALFPFAVGMLVAAVAYGRWQVAPHRRASPRAGFLPAN